MTITKKFAGLNNITKFLIMIILAVTGIFLGLTKPVELLWLSLLDFAVSAYCLLNAYRILRIMISNYSPI